MLGAPGPRLVPKEPGSGHLPVSIPILVGESPDAPVAVLVQRSLALRQVQGTRLWPKAVQGQEHRGQNGKRRDLRAPTAFWAAARASGSEAWGSRPTSAKVQGGSCLSSRGHCACSAGWQVSGRLPEPIRACPSRPLPSLPDPAHCQRPAMGGRPFTPAPWQTPHSLKTKDFPSELPLSPQYRG